MEQRYSIILFILLLFSCAKEDLVEDEIVDNPVIQYEWLTFSERFTDINETTGFFKNQEYFQVMEKLKHILSELKVVELHLEEYPHIGYQMKI